MSRYTAQFSNTLDSWTVVEQLTPLLIECVIAKFPASQDGQEEAEDLAFIMNATCDESNLECNYVG
jgi:hypothetical protein